MWAMGEEPDEGVRPAELIAAISLATDIGMAQPLETGPAVCLVAVELAGRRHPRGRQVTPGARSPFFHRDGVVIDRAVTGDARMLGASPGRYPV